MVRIPYLVAGYFPAYHFVITDIAEIPLIELDFLLLGLDFPVHWCNQESQEEKGVCRGGCVDIEEFPTESTEELCTDELPTVIRRSIYYTLIFNEGN